MSSLGGTGPNLVPGVGAAGLCNSTKRLIYTNEFPCDAIRREKKTKQDTGFMMHHPILLHKGD